MAADLSSLLRGRSRTPFFLQFGTILGPLLILLVIILSFIGLAGSRRPRRSSMNKRKLPPASLQSSSSYKRTNWHITRCEWPWASLPEEILATIAELLTAPDGIDFVRFGAVCKSWRSAGATVNFTLVRQMPWIMLQPTSDHSRETRLFNPSENKFYNFPLPEARWTTVCATVNKGWVATVGDDGCIHLLDLNPCTRQPRRITLPSLHAAVGSPPAIPGQTRFLKKICLPASPAEDPDAMVVAIYGSQSQLAFARLCTQSWTTITCSKLAFFSDVAYFKGRFYAVSGSGDVMKLDLHRRRAVKIASAPMTESAASHCLVESNGDLLQVGQCEETMLRKVFKLDFQSRQWEVVKSLGERSLFLGRRNCSMSLHAPHYSGCRSNCIYFITQEFNSVDSMVVYSLDEDKEIETRHVAQSVCHGPINPLWVSPFLWWQKI